MGHPSKLQELRIYEIKPEYFAAYLKLTSEMYHLRTKHSPLLGYWITEIGGQNEVCHLWEWESLEQRAQVREAMKADKSWFDDYLSKILPWLVKQSNILLRGELITTLDIKLETKYWYQIIQFSETKDEPIRASLRTTGGQDVQCCGDFTVILGGPQGERILILRASSPSDLLELVDIVKIKATSSRLLTAAPWSSKFGAVFYS